MHSWTRWTRIWITVAVLGALCGTEAARAQSRNFDGWALEARRGNTLPVPCFIECSNPSPEIFNEILVEVVLTEAISVYGAYDWYRVPQNIEPERASGLQVGLRFRTSDARPLAGWARGGILMHRRTAHWTSPTTLERLEVRSGVGFGLELGLGAELEVFSVGQAECSLGSGLRYHAYTPEFDLTNVFGSAMDSFPSETRYFVADLGLRLAWSRR